MSAVVWIMTIHMRIRPKRWRSSKLCFVGKNLSPNVSAREMLSHNLRAIPFQLSFQLGRILTQCVMERLTWHNEVFGVILSRAHRWIRSTENRKGKHQLGPAPASSWFDYDFELWKTKITSLYFAWKVFWASAAETDARKSTLSAAEAANLELESRTSCSIQIDRQSCWSCWWPDLGYIWAFQHYILNILGLWWLKTKCFVFTWS